MAYLSNTMPQNYGHWFIYTLPMLEIYWKFIDKKEIDYYYIGGGSLANFQKETLVALGIKEEQVVTFPSKPDRAITCVIDRKTQNNGYKYPTIFAYRFARNLFYLKIIMPIRNIPNVYVKRGNVDHREVINDNEVVEYLESIGFESLTM
jgi:capsular polysaccharide biosynthesis protein